ncbi:MarR family winged helix-turn-helix transcriptional regulator [Halovulum sp. GXIMD14793]
MTRPDAPGNEEQLALTLFAEVTALDQLSRAWLKRALPRDLELSQFSVLDVLAHAQAPETPVQLSRRFNVTKAAITNTLGKLERAGYVHITPDWDDARRKLVTISPAGRRIQDEAIQSLAPHFRAIVSQLGPDTIRTALPFLRVLRQALRKG